MKKIKHWILYNVIARFSYNYWIRLREQSKDEYGEKLCYCGHTDKCSCSNPDKQLFSESVERGSIVLIDKNNGWSTFRQHPPSPIGKSNTKLFRQKN